MKHIFILNPTAASGKTKHLESKIVDYCTNNNLDFRVIITTHENHACEIAKKFTIEDDVCLYSIGGDGTAYEILNGINDKVPLSIIPAGTGNDFFRMIYDDNTDIMQIIIDSINGRLVKVDYGLANNKRFINSTTMGLDARVNDIVVKALKKSIIPKKLIYSLAASYSILNPKIFDITLELDDQIIKQKSLLVAIMNGKYYGNGVNPIQDVSIVDGYFDIIVIEDVSVIKLMNLLPKYLKGNTSNISEMKIYRSKKVKLSSNELIDCQSDGENFKSSSIIFDINENALTLKVPNYSKLY